MLINRNRFLQLRTIQTNKAKRMAELDKSIIVVDAGDEIICDVCNALVEDETLYIENDMLLCISCQMEE